MFVYSLLRSYASGSNSLLHLGLEDPCDSIMWLCKVHLCGCTGVQGIGRTSVALSFCRRKHLEVLALADFTGSVPYRRLIKTPRGTCLIHTYC